MGEKNYEFSSENKYVRRKPGIEDSQYGKIDCLLRKHHGFQSTGERG